MTDIYERARCVLVLDADMLAFVPNQHRFREEILMRLTFPGWNQRLCTLQEVSFNQDVFVAFNGQKVLHIGRALTDITSRSHNDRQLQALDRNLIDTFRANLPRLPVAALGNSETSIQLLIDLYGLQSFKYRTTSRARDESICIATWLDLDVERLLQLQS